jgi:hypothetical protein
MSFSAYLVGTWENGRIPNLGTMLQIINPTDYHLHIAVAFFDSDEKPLRLLKSEEVLGKPLSPNDMWEIYVPSLDQQRPVKGFGVVKIISLDVEDAKKVKEGIVGFQRHLLAINIPATPPELEVAFSESPLAAIPLRESDNPRDPRNNWQREYDDQILGRFP